VAGIDLAARTLPPWTRFAVRRVAQAVVVLWAAYTLGFVLFFLLPSDPVRIMIGPENAVDEAQIAVLRAEYGLDRPAWERYLDGLARALGGDLGTSFQTGRPVAATIADAVPRTLTLAASALVPAIVIGTALAWCAAYTRARIVRDLLAALPGLALSVPTFWLGLVLLQVFSFRLRLLPARGDHGWQSLVLPAVTLALPAGALLAQVLVARLFEAWRDPYVTTARAKGVSRARALTAHALPNAVMPTLTMLGLLVGWLLSGSVVVETVFARNGLGRLVHAAVTSNDLPMLLGLVLVATVVFVVVTLVVDILHPLLDPRVAP
jgi:peptide/nickel transport system permease protein